MCDHCGGQRNELGDVLGRADDLCCVRVVLLPWCDLAVWSAGSHSFGSTGVELRVISMQDNGCSSFGSGLPANIYELTLDTHASIIMCA